MEDAASMCPTKQQYGSSDINEEGKNDDVISLFTNPEREVNT